MILLAVEAVFEALALAGAIEIGDAVGEAVRGGPFLHDGKESRVVVVEAGGAADQDVLAGGTDEDVAAAAVDEEIAAGTADEDVVAGRSAVRSRAA